MLRRGFSLAWLWGSLAMATSCGGARSADTSRAGGTSSETGGGGVRADGQGGLLATSGASVGGAGATGGTPDTAGLGASAGSAGDTTGGLPGGAAGSGAGASPVTDPAASQLGAGTLTQSGLSLVSYGGYLNGESFQEEGIITHEGYEYTAFWNTERHVVMARRALPDGPWLSFVFSDYTNTEADAHNTISLGICPADGTLHVAFDHHVSPLHYRKSRTGFVDDPAGATWAASSFSAVSSSLASGAVIKDLTYPRFVSEPGGGKLLFSARLGSSGSGDEYLWEYDSTTHAWSSLGKYLDGLSDNVNAYLHGLTYGRSGTRLHAAWCWRETPDASTNHDLFYAYSDDDGRTWQSNAGVVVSKLGSSSIQESSQGAEVWKIGQNRGLINQEHLAVDSAGRVHVLLSHLPDGAADDAVFDSARAKSQYFDYWRDSNGVWSRVSLGLPAVAAFRGKLAISSSNLVYAILPDLRIAAASATTQYKTWSLLATGDASRFFSDPLIDTARLSEEDVLSVVYARKASEAIDVIDYSLR